jgi:hypothetical protein
MRRNMREKGERERVEGEERGEKYVLRLSSMLIFKYL